MALPAQRTNLATNPSMAALGSDSTILTNLVENPSFETGTTGVTVTTAVTVSTTTFASSVAVGTQALLTSIGAGAGTSSCVYQNVNVTAGQYVAFGVTARWSTGSRYMRQRIVFKDASSANVGSLTFGPVWQGSSATSGGDRHVLSDLAPATAVTANLYIYYYDDVSATVAPVNPSTLSSDAWSCVMSNDQTYAEGAATAYFDGATAAIADNTYGWTGTAHASTSTMRRKSVPTVGCSSGTGGVAFATRASIGGGIGNTYYARALWTSGATGTGGMYVRDGTGVTGDIVSVGIWVRYSVAGNANIAVTVRNGAADVISVTGPSIYVPADTWTYFSYEKLVVPGTFTYVQVWPRRTSAMPAGSTQDISAATIEKATTAGTFFDGSTLENGWTHAWTGTANASTSTRNVYGLWVDVILTGTAHTQLTVIALGGTTATTKITRSDGTNNWPVPGWLGRKTVDADTATDWTPPLGRPLTYTLFKDGIAIVTRIVTVAATTGDIMDPLNPAAALRINTLATDPNTLTLGEASVKSIQHENTSSDREYPLGGRFPIARPGVRGAAAQIPFTLNAAQNTVSDALLGMVRQAPILLIRPLPSWGALPSLIYTDAPLTETPFNRGRGGQFTQWQLDADAVAPMTRASMDGKVTNDAVKANLAGRTHDSIKAASGTKRHVEIKANPLGLGQ